MIYNQLTVRPTDTTLSYLASIMSGSPLDLDMMAMEVQIITTEDQVVADPDREYVAQAVNVEVFYDSYTQSSNLIATLVSPDLQQRCIELNQEGIARSFYDWYVPFLVIKKQMPALSRHYRTFKVSLANAMCGNERPLVFTGEYVQQVDLMAPPYADYIATMAQELRFRHNA